MAKQDDYTRYTIRVPTELYEKIEAAAGEKSVNAEVVERLYESFEERLDYQQLAELGIATMEQIVEESRQDLAHARVMASQLALMRHVLDRVIEARGDLPADLRVLVDLLKAPSDGPVPLGEEVTAQLLVAALQATVDLEKIEVEWNETSGSKREARIEKTYQLEQWLDRQRRMGRLPPLQPASVPQSVPEQPPTTKSAASPQKRTPKAET